jgi:hypothetical protein
MTIIENRGAAVCQTNHEHGVRIVLGPAPPPDDDDDGDDDDKRGHHGKGCGR